MAEEYGLGSLRGVQDFTDDTSLGDYFSGEDTATPAQPSFIPEGYRPIELPNGTTAYVYKDYTDEQAIAELYKRNREAFAPQHTHPRHKPIPEGHAAQQEPPDEEFEKAKDQDKIVRELKEQDAKQQIIRNALYAEQQMPTAFNGQEAPLTPAPPADPQQLLRQKIAARVLNAQPTTPLAFEGALTPEQIAAGYIQPDPSKQGFLPGLAGGAAGLVGGVGGFAAENLQPFYPEAAESVRQAVAPMRAAEKAWHRPQSELERIQAHNQPGVMPGVQAELTHAGDVLGGFFGKWGVPMLASKAGPYGATAGVGLTYSLLFDEFAQKAKEAKVPLSLPELHAGAALSTALFQLAPNFITKGIPFNAIAPSTKMIVDLYRTQGPEAAYKAVGNLAQNMVKSFAAGTVGATGAMVGTEAVQRQMLGQPQLTLEEATEMAKDAGIISAAMAYPHGRAATAEGRQAFAREAARDVRQRIAAREADETMRREGVRVSPEAINEQNIAREWPEMRTGAERDQAVGAETISAETPPPAPPPTEEPAPPPAEEPAPPPAEEPAPKAYYEDLGLSPRSNVFKALQQLDVNDPAAHPAIIETLDMAIANPRLKVKDVDAMQQLRDQLQPPEVLSAEQITEAGAPDGSGGPQPILREEGGDQAISGKGVEQSGQGEQVAETKAKEEKVAADWNKNKAADTPAWNMIPEGVRELYREHLKGFAYESPEEIYNNYEFNESGKVWDQMKQPETPAWADLREQHKIRVDFTDARKRGDFVLPENLLEAQKKELGATAEAALPQNPIEAWNAIKGEGEPEHKELPREAQAMWKEAFNEGAADKAFFDQLKTTIPPKAERQAGKIEEEVPATKEDYDADEFLYSLGEPTPKEELVDRAIRRLIHKEETGQDIWVPGMGNRQVQATLRKLLTQRDAGKITEEQMHSQLNDLLDQITIKAAEKRLKGTPRVRGADFIRQRLLEAKRKGLVTDRAADMAEWFIKKNPALVEDLGISIKGEAPRGDDVTAGFYDKANRVFTLIAENAKDTTSIHETLHHLERMMPANIRAGITKAWTRSLISARDKALKAGDEPTINFFNAALTGDARVTMKALEGLSKEQLGEHYQHFSPSEFWAVNGARILENRYNSSPAFLKRLATWLREFGQHVKGTLGLKSDAPILRAIDIMLKEKAPEYRTEKLLAEETGKQEARFLASYVGRQAIGADLAKRENAEKRLEEGEDPQKVRRETGWFKGEDGGWRYEIDDRSVEWKKDWDAIPKHSLFSAGEKLGDVLEGPVLEAYPELKDIEFKKTNALFDFWGSTLGWFNPETNLLVVTPNNKTAEDAKSTALHEIQHWVQHKENFTPGGNQDTVSLTDKDALDKYEAYLNRTKGGSAEGSRLFATLNKLRAPAEQAEIAQLEANIGTTKATVATLKQQKATVKEQMEQDLELWHKQAIAQFEQARNARLAAMNATHKLRYNSPEYLAAREKLPPDPEYPSIFGTAAKAFKIPYELIVKELEANIKSAESKAEAAEKAYRDKIRDYRDIQFSLYQMLGGERESRDVQARMYMSPEERGELPPYQLTNIREEEVIRPKTEGLQVGPAESRAEPPREDTRTERTKPLTKFERKSFLTGAREAISHIVMAAVDPNVLGKDYAKLRRQLVAESAGLAKALETQATYDPDVGIRVDYIRNQYDSAFQIVQEGLYTGVPMLEGKTGLTRIEPTSRLNLDRLMKDASELPLSISYDGTTKEPLAVMADIFRIKMGELEFQERDEAARKLQTLRNLPKATRERKDVKAEIEKLRELAKGDRERSVTQNDIDWANAEIRRVDGVQDILDRWAEINQHLLAFERDSGWLSKDAYDKLSERSAYIPLFMPMEDVLARRGEAPVYPGGGPTTIGRLMPKTGRGSLLSTNVYENMAKRYAAAISNGMMNNVKVRAYEQLYRLGLAERMPINTKAKENIVKMRKDGQEFVYRVTDSEAYNSLTMAGMWNHPLLDLAALPANLVRRTALFGNPEYYFRTIVYEPLAANFVSTARGAIGPVTPIDALYEMAKIALHISKSAPELQRYGVSGTTHMERAYERFAKGLSDAPRSQRLWKYMEKAHAAFDEATRNIIYKAAQKEAAKQGIDDPQVIKDIAAVKARDFADFGTRGSMQLMRAASKQVPFLHSHLVGMDKMIRSATGHGQNTEEGRRQKQRFISNALIGASTVVGLTLVNSQDKRYRDLPIKEWARNLIVGFDEDGRAIKIPIPQELGFLVKYLPEQLTRSLIGVSDAPETKKALHNMAMDTLMPPGMSDPTLVAFRGWLQLHTNTELYSGLPIESPQELLELPIDRNKRATIFAKELAKVAEEQGWDDYSPEKFDSFMRTYFTNLYSTTALAAEMYWDYRTGKRGLFELPFNKDVTERYPWVKVALSNPKNISAVPRFYEMAKPLYETLKSVNLLSHAGVDSDEHARYERLIADPVVMTRYRGAKIAEMYRKQIHNIENAIDQLGARKDLTEAERRRKYMDGIKSRNELARVAVERLSDMLLQDRKLWKDIANSTYQHMEVTRDELTKEIGDFGANIGEPSESPE